MIAGADRLEDAFGAWYGAPPQWVVRAPGRVNIIGEHTDYNDGFVLPMAIERYTTLAARPRGDRRLAAFAEHYDAYAEADLDDIRRSEEAPWLNYVLGVALELERLGHPVSGADVWIHGDIPIGAGLSSSASFEMASCLMFECLGGFSVAGPEAARLGRRVENDFLGLSSGIMDQFISRMAQRGRALYLDCRSLEFRQIPIRFEDTVFVIANTNAPHRLTSSKYNERVRECRDTVAALNAHLGREASHLRDFTPEDVERARAHLAPTLYRRARHVVRENVRTAAASAAMEAGDVEGLGDLMNASHESLRLDYEVTHDPDESSLDLLTAMVSIARELPGCHGARMTGGGFGGSTINLVAASHADAFADQLMARYGDVTGFHGSVIVSEAAAGAEAEAIHG